MSIGLLTSSLRTLKTVGEKMPYERALNFISTQVEDMKNSIVSKDYSHLTTRRTRSELVRLSAAVCGIEFCYAAETAFVSPTLLAIGVPRALMTLVWCASPLLGFFLVPILGSASDRCKFSLGRRRPFILILSIGIILGLLFVPNGTEWGRSLGDSSLHILVNSTDNSTTYNSTSHLVSIRTPVNQRPKGIFMTILGVIMLDMCCDGCQSPCRAYLLDVTVQADHPIGLTTFTILAGLGGSLGYIIGGIDWQKASLANSFSADVSIVFTLVLFIYIIAVLITITAVREIPLDKLELPPSEDQCVQVCASGNKYRKFSNEEDDVEGSTIYGATDNVNPIPKIDDGKDVGNTNISIYITKEQTKEENDEENTTNTEYLPSEVTIKVYLKSIIQMPRSMIILCLTNLFCWMSLVCYSLYFTDFVGQTVYGGDPSAEEGSEKRIKYENGVRMGSLGMSLYSISCSFYSLIIEKLVKKFSKIFFLSKVIIFNVE
ncbi:DgyrCDS12562 [Dimorphilus gyrociliatus]|uniref:DgyrCDS12562 n=1 Tax=Dimorphilus gyrociliatus TaxID=2664684 RepID=A0A7I8W7W1_9ANNE|nr:DgyrCDS12562 [Dimorphilus gyrociliatus]